MCVFLTTNTTVQKFGIGIIFLNVFEMRLKLT